MLFSSLYSMLPSAQRSLNKGGILGPAAAWITIGAFLGGVVGIQFVSRKMHHFIPSHIVDCDHTHDEDETKEPDHHGHDKGVNGNGHSHFDEDFVSEDTPLIIDSRRNLKPLMAPRSVSDGYGLVHPDVQSLKPESVRRRPTLQPKLTARMATFIKGSKSSCDEGGPCYGYGDPCGTECLKIGSRSPTRAFGRSSNAGLPVSRRPTNARARPRPTHTQTFDEESARISSRSTFPQRPAMGESEASTKAIFRGRQDSQALIEEERSSVVPDLQFERSRSTSSASESGTANENSHHHHVPSNAFLAIGLQTSIAIALHKLPEGFITYATNHANPTLGFSVFMALFIHNITEGFALALPLYLAINSRWKAMLWSSLLGGVSQPLGAGVAALWFKIAGNGQLKPGDAVYGCMFAVTAGIMASVALQLFSESLTLTHNRNTCTVFAFLGMGILGVSYALTA